MPRPLFLPGTQNPSYRPALDRFAEKCRFDPTTGCVLWTGGTTAGHGNSARYGVFWYEGRRWAAHRWAAIHIHHIVLRNNQAGHYCPYGPNTLCVQHIEAQTQLENLAEQHTRLKAKVEQTAEARQHWLFVSLGISQPPVVPVTDPDAVPFYLPPAWLQPYLAQKDICDD